MRSLLVVVLVAVIGCDLGGGRGTAPVLPDTQTVDGVLEMRHDADAFARAPQWVIDTVVAISLVPTARVSNPIYAGQFVRRLPDGTWAMIGLLSRRLVMFDSTGRDPREYWPDQRPGGHFRWSSLLTTSHDTAVVIDGQSRAIHRYTFDGRVRVDSFSGSEPSCLYAIGLLPRGRLLARRQCEVEPDLTQPTRRGRLPMDLVTTRADFDDVTPFATLPAVELAASPPKSSQRLVQLGQILSVAVWGTTVVTATGEHGYVLDLRTPDGTVTRRIVVNVPRRVVTPAMRIAAIEEWGQGTVADTMPPFERVMVGADSLLWVIDAFAPSDSAWTATAFRTDGAIAGRLIAARPLPEWFGPGQVMQVAWRRMNGYTRGEFHVKAIVSRGPLK